MVKKHAGTTVHVRKGVLRLAVFFQYIRRDFAVPLHELEDGVFGNFRAGRGKFHEGFEAGVGLSQDGVSIARNYLARLQGRPEVIFYGGVGEGGPDVGLHLEDPAKDFLGCEAMRLMLVSADKRGNSLKVEKHTHVMDRQDLAIQRCS